MDEQPIPYPPGFDRVNPHSLEDYISARCIQFARVFVNRCGLNMTQQEFEELVRQSLSLIPVQPISSGSGGQLQLVFRHDCLSLGCLDPQCSLCENNPNRRCDVNFDRKYLVNDVLKAKCKACIRVEVVDRVTGVLRTDHILDQLHLEISILDGNSYDAKCLEAGHEREEDLQSCLLLENNKGQQLLQAGMNATHTEDKKVHVALMGGKATLPDLHVTDSSEALLSGRKPPFRLLVRAIATGGNRLPRELDIHHAVSEAFVIATRRTRTAGKVEVPNVEDHVSKLEHMGKETVRKLKDIRMAAEQAGIDINIHINSFPNSVNKVGEFRKLSLVAEADGHLRQKLQQILKLSKEKWDEARDHALRSVVADNYLRVWYSDDSMDVGVLFPCRNGEIDLERPVGLLQKKKDSLPGGDPQYEVILLHQQTPLQRQQVKTLQRAAVQNWWRAGHIGWAIFPVDSEQLTSNDVQGSPLNAEQEFQATPDRDGNAAAIQPGYGGIGSFQQQGNTISPFATVAQEPFDQLVSGTGNSVTMANGAGLQITSTEQLTKIGSYNMGADAEGVVAGPQQVSAQGNPPPLGLSAGQQSARRQQPPQQPAIGAGLLSSDGFFNVSSQDFATATNSILSSHAPHDQAFLSQYTAAGSGFHVPPPLDGSARSGSLRMLGLKGMDSLDYTGSGIDISKLESMELPTELAGVGEPYLAGYGQLIGSSFSGLGGGGDLQRQSSGLESMQSIEHALPQVHPVQSNTNYAEVLEAAARDFRAQQQGEGAGGAGR